jgi:hypothetical protein
LKSFRLINMIYKLISNKLTLVSAILFCSITYGQRMVVKNDPIHDLKPIHFGFSIGLNFMDFRITESDSTANSNEYVGIREIKPGINIQAISNLRLGEYFDLRCLPGISFGERQLYFLDKDGNKMYDNKTYRIESSFLELPITLKYKAKRSNNFRPFLVAGTNFRYDLAIKGQYDYKDQLIMFKHFDTYFEFGGGSDFYLKYFKLGLELKYSLGMTNIFKTTDNTGKPFIKNAHYTNMIDQMKSNIFIISFHFE